MNGPGFSVGCGLFIMKQELLLGDAPFLHGIGEVGIEKFFINFWLVNSDFHWPVITVSLSIFIYLDPLFTLSFSFFLHFLF
jgi:hypothetical protein